MPSSVERRPPSGWDSTSPPEDLPDDEFILVPAEDEGDEPSSQVIEFDEEDFDDAFTSPVEQRPKPEPYRSFRERKTEGDEDQVYVLELRAKNLDAMLRSGQYPSPVQNELTFFDLAEDQKWPDKNERSSYKKTIPEQFLSDPATKREVQNVVRAMQHRQPLLELMNEAYRVGKEGDRKKLVALKLVGMKFVQKFAPQGDRSMRDLSGQQKECLRLGEIMTIFTELAEADIQRQQGTLKGKQALALAKRFAVYAKNDDLPDLIREPLRKASRILSNDVRPRERGKVQSPGVTSDPGSVLDKGSTKTREDTDVIAAVDTDIEPDEAAVIPITEDELRYATPLKSPADFARQQQEVEAMMPPRADRPSPPEPPLRPEVVISPMRLYRGAADIPPAYQWSAAELNERDQFLNNEQVRYEQSRSPEIREAAELLKTGERIQTGQTLDDFESFIIDRTLDETLPDNDQEVRRYRYLKIWRSELERSWVQQEGVFLNRVTSGPLRNLYARLRVNGTKGLLTGDAGREVMAARHDFVQSLRRAADKVDSRRNPFEKALMVQIANRLEALNVTAARRQFT